MDLSGEFFCLFCTVCFIFSIRLVAKKQPPNNVGEYSAVQLSVQSGSRRGINVKAAETSLNGFLSGRCREDVLITHRPKSWNSKLFYLKVPKKLTPLASGLALNIC